MFPLILLLSCSSESEPVQSKSNLIQSEQSEKKISAPRVIFLGDSLTAGQGLPSDQAYPKLLEQLLIEAKEPTEILNAGISGDTTSGGLRRLDWLLKQKPQLLVLELGANDGLRGTAIEEIERNLSAIIEQTKAQNIDVLLVGMRIPPNYGTDYAESFDALYPKLAAAHQIPLVPFLLDGVAGDPALNQPDGIHPTAEGHQILSKTMLEPILSWRKSIK